MHGDVSLPVLESSNGLAAGIRGFGVGSKQKQLRKCLYRYELHTRTFTCKHNICNGYMYVTLELRMTLCNNGIS